jgi:hypothetical protein
VKGLALLYRGKKLEMTDREEEEQFHTMREDLQLMSVSDIIGSAPLSTV